MTTFIGIDLGTSHSSLATIGDDADARLLNIPQLASEHETVEDDLLPSVYFDNFEYKDLRLPWMENPPVLGRFARDLAISNPQRAIVSAKSWLGFKGDLRLPPNGEGKGLTAKDVSTLLLSHLVKAWEWQESQSLASVDAIALTVPASFDPLARELTEEAARAAGIPNPILIEEPLAAFYAWLEANKDWNKQLEAGDSVLVCDVGGGTCDFSLIAVEETDGELRLDRIAVGRHLLLGGDNMDLALAHHLAQQHGALDHWQFISLQQQIRKAKELLLSPEATETFPISVSSRGSSLFAKAVTLELSRADVESFLVDGFFPLIAANAPIKRSMGLQAMGLPYEHDPAITKHLASFLKQAQKNKMRDSADTAAASELFQPTHILFNGGVFKAKILQERVTQCLAAWSGAGPTLLENPDLDHAVTLGAAFYAAIKGSGAKLRVRTRASRSYYIGLEANQMAVPGMKPRLQGLCVLPQGTDEGSEYELSDQEFALWGGEQVSFQLFSSEERADLGTLVANAEQDLETVSELSCQIDDEGEGPIPVFLQSDYDETGKLRVAIRERSGARRWDLNFQLREESLR